MKKSRLNLILFLLAFLANFSFGQTLPPVPKRITMFDLNINLEENVRRTVEKEMAFLASKRVYVDAKLAKMSQYFPIIETIFDQENVPREFKYLCAQESSFIADAVSTSNAVGFWQFKSGTAIDYGLRVDDLVDERKNIVASTRAAALYLNNNNKTYRNWVSTLLSYRLGLTGAKNQVPANWTGATEITITSAIDWYVIRNIAHFIYFENELSHFQPSGSYFYLYNRASGKSFADIAQELQINETELRKENVWCKTDIVPSDKEYTVLTLIKKDQKTPILAQENALNKPFFDIEVGYPVLKINERKSKKAGAVFYTINSKEGILSIKGDTPESIAERAELKLQYFLSYNDLDKTSSVRPQMVYYLEKKNRKAKVPKHTVKKGQNIWLVSQMYGIRQNKLLRMNRMKENDALQEGRVLNLIEKRKRKEDIEFIRKPFENEQLPTERPQIIISNTTNTFPNKTNVPNNEVDLTTNNSTEISRPIIETKKEDKPFVYTETNNTGNMKIIVRDMGEKNVETTKEPVFSSSNTTNKSDNFIIVKAGENLFNLAKKYNISVTDLKKANGLNVNTVEIGQKLYLPKSAEIKTVETSTLPKTNTSSTSNTSSNTKTSSNTNSNKSSKANYHIVQAGETLYRVSVIHKVPVDKLKQINNLVDNTISVGQKIYISK